MKWSEIKNNKNYCHNSKVVELIQEAQKRLKKLRLDDIDELIGLKIDGRKRLWGFVEDNIFKVIWYDPEHEIYPSTLKHT